MQIAIQVSELKFFTGDGVLVLDSLSFGVRRDGFVFVVGPPSSGKTLLVRLILRELVPAGGQILLVGRNVARLSPQKVAQLRRRVGYVPEQPAILTDRTVRDNLLFKLRALGVRGEELEEGISAALQLAGLSGLEAAPAGELPPLDRTRVALALALCPKPMVLVADDPFRHLPPGDQDRLMEVLLRIHRAGVALLVTARDEDIPRRHGFPQGVSQDSPLGVLYLRQGVSR